ncbi:MAG: sugar phosphate isomerase/epimerase family protein [Candidatus Bathyarchaeia archaeon]
MKLGISTLCFISKNFNFILKFLAEKFDVLWEIVDDGDHFLNEERIFELNKLRNDKKIEYSLHAPYASINISATNPLVREYSQKLVLNSIEHARKLECKYIILHPGGMDVLASIGAKKNEIKEITSSYIGQIVDICQAQGIMPLIENMSSSRMLLRKTEEIQEFINSIKSLKIVLDIGHAFVVNELDDMLLKLFKKIAYLHISDNDGLSDKHWQLDKGKIPWRKIIDFFRIHNFDGPLVIENLNWFDAKASLTILKNYLE